MKFKLDGSDVISLIAVLAIMMIGLYFLPLIIQSIPTQNTSSNITEKSIQNISQILGPIQNLFPLFFLILGCFFIIYILVKFGFPRSHYSEESREVIKTTIPLPKKPEDTTFPKPLVPLSKYPQQNGDYILFTETSKSLSKEITTVQESLGLWTQTVPVDDKNVVIYISKWSKKDTHIHGGISPLWKPITLKK